MRNVTFIADPLRSGLTQVPSVKSMSGWIKALMDPACRALGIETRWLYGAFEGGTFPDAALMEALELPKSPEGWIRATSLDGLPAACEGIIEAHFDTALVVGFVPDWLKSFLIRRSIPFIDYEINSIRYMQDLLLNVRTNVAGFHATAQDFAIDEGLLVEEAAVYAGRVVSGTTDFALAPHEDAVIFFGQTDIDKALIWKGELATPETVGQALMELLAPFGTVLFKRHPYAQSDDWLRYIADRRDVKVVNGPAYDILGSQYVRHVAALSSGVIDEARYFHKDAVRLFQPDMQTIRFAEEQEAARLRGGLFAPHTVEAWLAPILAEGIDAPYVDLRSKQGDARTEMAWARLRRSTSSDWFSWGYGKSGLITLENVAPAGEAPVESPADEKTTASEENIPCEAPPEPAQPRPIGLGEDTRMTLDDEPVDSSASGFSEPYEQGRWMMAQSCRFEARLSERVAASALDVTLSLIAIPTPRHPTRVLSVTGPSGRVLARVRLDRPYGEPQRLRFRLPRHDGFDGDRIRFGLSAPLANLAAEGVSDDDRDLGPCLVSIRVDRAWDLH